MYYVHVLAWSREGVYSAIALYLRIGQPSLLLVSKESQNIMRWLPLLDVSVTKNIISMTVNILSALRQNIEFYARLLWVLYVLVDLEKNGVSCVCVWMTNQIFPCESETMYIPLTCFRCLTISLFFIKQKPFFHIQPLFPGVNPLPFIMNSLRQSHHLELVVWWHERITKIFREKICCAKTRRQFFCHVKNEVKKANILPWSVPFVPLLFLQTKER